MGLCLYITFPPKRGLTIGHLDCDCYVPVSDKPDSSSAPGSKSDGASKAEDIYEFKTTALTKEGPPSSRTVSPDQANSSGDKSGVKDDKKVSSGVKDDKKLSNQQLQQLQAGEKRGHDNEDDEESR